MVERWLVFSHTVGRLNTNYTPCVVSSSLRIRLDTLGLKKITARLVIPSLYLSMVKVKIRTIVCLMMMILLHSKAQDQPATVSANNLMIP